MTRYTSDCFGGTRQYANDKKSFVYAPKNSSAITSRIKVTPYIPKFNGKVSIFETQKPNRLTRTVDNMDQSIGEAPPRPFSIMYEYRDLTPQIDAIVEYCVDLIVGTDININSDDETAKELLEKFADEIELYEKIRSLTDDALTGGTAIFARIFANGMLANIEQFDMTTLKKVKRDSFGNIKSYIIDVGYGQEDKIQGRDVLQTYVPLVFRPRGRDFFGRSLFHGLAVERNVGNRTTRPIIETLWSLDDVVVGTLENFAYPTEYHIFDGINDKDLEIEAQKFKERKPGDVFFLSRMHEIERREPTQAKFDSFFEHSSNIVQLGTGFPLEILLGDFTSRASSQTTDSLLMRRIKAFQQHLVKVIKKEILEVYIKNHKSKWKSPEDISALNISVEFETQTPMEYTPDQVLARVNSKMWSIDEGRQFDKANGQDLFDDDKIGQMQSQQELQKELQPELDKNQELQQKDSQKYSQQKHTKKEKSRDN